MPVSAACAELSVDLFEPVDLIHGWDILDDATFHSLLCSCESGLVGAALAAPYPIGPELASASMSCIWGCGVDP